MRRLFALFLIATLALTAGAVMAQEDTTEEDIIVIELADVLVICPGSSVLPSVRETAELVVEFSELDDVLVIPVGVVSESADGITTVTIGRFRLTCDSTASEVTQIDRSPPVEANETAPQPENAPGVAELQSGYLVVFTQNANLRSCDQPTCTRVAIVTSSDYLVALGTNGEVGDRLWWYVQVDDTRGWIWGELVVGRGDLSDLPVIETAGESTPPTVYIGYTGNPLYDELSDSGQIICNILANDNYPLLGRNSDTSWVWIEAQCLDGTTVQGWITADAVAIRNTGQVFVPILGPEGLASD